MKHSFFFVPLTLSALLLAGCGQNAAQGDPFDNPLYARFYYQDLANHMADYSIQNDPIMKDADKKKIVEDARADAMKGIADASAIINAGKRGSFMSDTDYAGGSTLLSGNTLYFSQDFNTYPGPSLHVFASTLLDPRGESGSIISFPNDASVDLGPLQSPYLAQAYDLPEEAKDMVLRTVVLWDTKLERIFGFAQLQ